MRPRVFPAEDRPCTRAGTRRRSFNEAAGIPRGRLDTAFFRLGDLDTLQ